MPAERTTRDLVAALAVLVALNVLTVSVLDEAVAAVVQVAVAVGAVGLAMQRGYSRGELGLSRRTVGAGVRLGTALSVIVVVGVVMVAAIPFTNGFLDDDRFVDISGWRVAYEVLVRIPIVTAMSEELLFRSVLLAVMSAITTRGRAVVASSVCFGLWHVLVTLDDLGGNAATDSLTTAGRIGGVAGAVAATAVAGGVFAWTRLRSGSVLAPWLLHSSLNGATFVAGYVVTSA